MGFTFDCDDGRSDVLLFNFNDFVVRVGMDALFASLGSSL